MRQKLKLGAALAGLLIGGASAAWAAGFLTSNYPLAGNSQYPTTLPLTGNEQAPFDTLLASGQNPQSEAINMNQIANFASGAFGGFRNYLIAGDASQNLFQRATTGSSVTTTLTYGGPDRWAYWSGANAAMTVSQDSTASDLPSPGFKYAYKMAITSGQTNTTLQNCMEQVIESPQAIQLQGQTVSFDFYAYTGANFYAANNAMTAYIVTGTGTDEGAAKMAYGLNAGGGGGSAWAGQVSQAAGVINLQGVSTAGRYAVAANIPTNATEIGVAVCWTPNLTASTNTYVAFDGLQLYRNPSAAPFVAATAATNTVGYNVATSGFPAANFERRPQQVETALQERYTYVINEGTITAGTTFLTGMAPSSTTCLVNVPFPVTMRTAPTYTNALSGTTFKLNAAAANTALTTAFSVTTGANTVYNGSVTFTASGLGATAGWACSLVSAAGSGQMTFTAEE